MKRPVDRRDYTATLSDSDLTGAYAWPSGTRLSLELEQLAECHDKDIADLGCGLGQLGFTALTLGARRVVFADGSAPVVDVIARTIALNHLHERAHAILHQWGDPLPGGPFSLILGGDILYRPECFGDLACTINSSLSPDGMCLLSEPRRSCDEDLVSALDGHSLRYKRTRRELGYSLLRLARI